MYCSRNLVCKQIFFFTRLSCFQVVPVPKMTMTPTKDGGFMMAPQTTTCQHKASKVASVGFNILSTVLFGFSTAVIKKSKLDGNTATLATGVMGVLIGLCSYLFSNQPLISLRKVLKIGASGVCFGGLFNFFYFLSLEYITLGDSTAVNIFSSFLTSLILEIFYLKHRPHYCSYVSGIFGLVGVMLITQLEALSTFSVNSNHLLGVFCTLFSGAFGAIFYINMQKFRQVPCSVLLIGYFLGSSIFPLPKFFRENFTIPSASIADRCMAISGYGMFVFAALCAIMGSQLSVPSAAFVIKMFSIVFCFLLQVFWLHETTSVTSLIGAVFIGASIFVQAVTVVVYSSPFPKVAQKDPDIVWQQPDYRSRNLESPQKSLNLCHPKINDSRKPHGITKTEKF